MGIHRLFYIVSYVFIGFCSFFFLVFRGFPGFPGFSPDFPRIFPGFSHIASPVQIRKQDRITNRYSASMGIDRALCTSPFWKEQGVRAASTGACCIAIVCTRLMLARIATKREIGNTKNIRNTKNIGFPIFFIYFSWFFLYLLYFHWFFQIQPVAVTGQHNTRRS